MKSARAIFQALAITAYVIVAGVWFAFPAARDDVALPKLRYLRQSIRSASGAPASAFQAPVPTSGKDQTRRLEHPNSPPLRNDAAEFALPAEPVQRLPTPDCHEPLHPAGGASRPPAPARSPSGPRAPPLL